MSSFLDKNGLQRVLTLLDSKIGEIVTSLASTIMSQVNLKQDKLTGQAGQMLGFTADNVVGPIDPVDSSSFKIGDILITTRNPNETE